MKKIRLAGPLRYNYKGTVYEAGRTYAMKDNLADILIRSRDPQTGFRYFEEALPPRPVEEVKAEAPKPKTDEEIENELNSSDTDAVIVDDDYLKVEDLSDADLI